jgi:hypothetical protein
MWLEKKMLPWMNIGLRRRYFPKEEMGLGRGCGSWRRCCLKMNMDLGRRQFLKEKMRPGEDVRDTPK